MTKYKVEYTIDGQFFSSNEMSTAYETSNLLKRLIHNHHIHNPWIKKKPSGARYETVISYDDLEKAAEKEKSGKS